MGTQLCTLLDLLEHNDPPPILHLCTVHLPAFMSKGSASVAVYILEEDAAGATGGCSPIHLNAGAPARSALRHCRGAVGHELRFLLINDL